MTITISHYGQIISRAVARTDAATVNLLEELLQEESGGVLDHRSAAWLSQRARQTLAEIETDHDIVRLICDGYAMPVPEWAQA